MEGDARKSTWFRWAALAVGLVAAVLVALWLQSLLTPKGPVEKMKVQQITLVRPPPPPPPPPPEQKPPEPEVKDEVEVEQPAPTPEETAQTEEAPAPLNVGEGAEGGIDVGGSRGAPTLAGSGGGLRGNPWAWYDALLNEAINAAVQTALGREEALKHKSYRVIVNVWLDANGKVTRAQLVDTTGDTRADDVLREALRNVRALREGPPSDMPQPVKVRVTSRA